MRKLGVEYPVVQDNDFAIWKAFDNRYWPAACIVDKQGHMRYHLLPADVTCHKSPINSALQL